MPRGKSTNNLKRSIGNKKARSYFLIVVEGKETEYNYFNALINELKLPTTKIEIISAAGGDPLKIVDRACKVKDNNEKGETGNTLKFDKVFCVFDDDNKIEKFKQAISKANENDVIPITSIPCFEFWFLLHYCYTTKPFTNYRELLRELETEMRKAGILKQRESYDKSDSELYKKLKPKQLDALHNASLLEQKHPNLDGCSNPSTKVHTLVTELQQQKEFK